MTSFDTIREIIYRGASAKTWEALVAALCGWPAPGPPPEVVDYCRDHLRSWPPELPTFAPDHWHARPASELAADPLVGFFTEAAMGRTGHFLAEARQKLTQGRAPRPPKFLDFGALGPLRWRDGDALSEDQRGRFVAWLKTGATEASDVGLRRLRQLLDDEDCQRWSLGIYKAWEAAGAASRDKWAWMQMGYLGHTGTFGLDGDGVAMMVSGGRQARARECLNLIAAFDNAHAYALLVDVIHRSPLHHRSASEARSTLHKAARARKRKLEGLLADGVDCFMGHRRTAANLVRACGTRGRIPARERDLLAALMQQSMLDMVPWTLDQLEGLLGSAAISRALRAVIWRDAAGVRCRWSGEGWVGLDGAAEAAEGPLVVLHPALMSAEERQEWRAHLEGAGVDALMPQLDRPVHDLRTPLPADVEIKEPLHYGRAGWQPGPEEGAGFASSLRLLPFRQTWHLSASINYQVHVGELELMGDAPWRVEKFNVETRLLPLSGELKAVVHSEAVERARGLIEALEPT